MTGVQTCALPILLSEWLGEVAAMDLSLEMLRHAPTTAPRVQADASSLPLAAGTVGVLVAVNMFLFPLEVDRVLAAGGVLLWVSSLAERTPIYLSAADVRAALPGDWAGVAARAGGGSWCVMRRTSATTGQSS